MGRRSRVGVVLVGMALASGLVPLDRASPASDFPPGFLDQRIHWERCAEGSTANLPLGADLLECGSYRVPRNWEAPDGVELSIAVSRLRPVLDAPRGTLFTNPGGPGAPGRGLPLLFLEARRQKVVDQYEIVGIDVRGTGASTNTTCALQSKVGEELDPRDRRPENLETILDGAAYVARACQNAAGDLGPFITTAQTVRDLDLLRILLGREQVSWVGYSGGTWLGGHYASRYPHRVDRVVLDAVAEFTAPWQKVFSHQPLGFQRRFREDFLNYVAINDISFQLGRTVDVVNREYEALRARLAAEPLPFGEDGAVYPVELDLLLAQAMYSKELFQGAASDLRELRDMARARDDGKAGPTGSGISASSPSPGLAHRIGQARAKASTAGMMTMSPDAFAGTFLSIACNDTPWPGDRAGLRAESEAVGRQYPLTGWYGLSEPCVFWKRPAATLPRPTGAGVPPTLMVNSERDPATSIEGARAARDAFAGAHLLTVIDDGDHGNYMLRDNRCVDDIVEAFLIDGVLPAQDATCPGQPIPPPSRAPDAGGLVDALKSRTAVEWSLDLARRAGLS